MYQFGSVPLIQLLFDIDSYIKRFGKTKTKKFKKYLNYL